MPAPIPALPTVGLPQASEPVSIEMGAVYDESLVFPASSDLLKSVRLFPCGRGWFRGEVLLWWLQSYETPPLVATSPVGTDPTAIGLPGSSRTLFGGDGFGEDLRVGGRIRGGWWLDDCRCAGIEGEFFGVGGADDDFETHSNGNPLLARPFYNSNPAVDGPDAEILAADGIATAGSVSFHSSSQIYSAAALMRANLSCCEPDACALVSRRLDLLFGYRYFHLEESLNSFETFMPSGMFYAPGTYYELSDVFETQNEFHGAEIGLHYQRQSGRWVVELDGCAVFGRTTREVWVDGWSRAIVPGVIDASVPGGFLSSGTQLGTHRKREFGVLPQAAVTLGYCFTPRLRFNVGYDFLYLNNAVRPGSILPKSIDSDTFFSGAGSQPLNIEAVDEGVWLQGIRLGLTYYF